jgi:hypothetical protein
MTEHAPDRVWSGIDIPKTIAGALAAVCAAVVGSFLGVAGTLVGAAVASIVGSVGTEIYQRSLHKGAQKLQTLAAPAFIKAPAAVGTPAVAAAAEEDSPSHTVPEKPKPQIRWGRVAMIAGALFVLAMGTLTVTELITGKSVAATVGNNTGATTTFGGIFDPGSGKTPATTPTPTPTPSDTSSTSDDPTTAPSTKATSEAPAASEPAGGGTSDTNTPAPDAPAPTGGDSGGGQTGDQTGGQNVDPGQGGGQTGQTGKTGPEGASDAS